MNNKIYSLLGISTMLATSMGAQQAMEDDPVGEEMMNEVTVVSSRPGTSRMAGAMNGTIINKTELFKMACCNLGESFSTNPSVDINYSDAATGARQIKLLGLSGTYVQMLTENLPDFRGAAMPYSLGYVPGTWMKSIQVSKGASSVKNGYESITGQINVDYLKPEDEQGMSINLYGNTMSKMEANAEGNIHLNKQVSTELLGHFENNWEHHDKNNDGWQDSPNNRQFNFQNRWHAKTDHYIFHGGLGLLNEDRKFGPAMNMNAINESGDIWHGNVKTNRYGAYMKHAFMLNPEHGTNVALLAHANMHEQDAIFGYKNYYVNEKNLYASLLLEHHFNQNHEVSAGVSFNHDYFGQLYNLENMRNASRTRWNEKENVPGAYAQYTYELGSTLTAMAGIRMDHSNLYGTFATPRFHLKWQASDLVGLRFSAGKGYRAVHPLAEYSYLLASGRQFSFDQLDMEEAWNFGTNTQWNIPIGNKYLKVNADYYYTRFNHQAVLDLDSNPHAVHIGNLKGLSYSHVFQIDATYPLFEGLTMTAAYRYNDARETIQGKRMEKPLQSRYKGLFTASYKTPLGIWQFDATLQLNGGGRMPKAYTLIDGSPSWNSHFNAYEMLNLQVTRWFRNFSVYVGGENLTNRKQKNAVIDGGNPWGKNFDTTTVYGPVEGAMGYVGIRYNIGRL
ncbi:MAG: TonB-dependent receptor [Bacteroidales bacterium]|nr:TonB-dependent receptor [Bacteroidales bacterium]